MAYIFFQLNFFYKIFKIQFLNISMAFKILLLSLLKEVSAVSHTGLTSKYSKIVRSRYFTLKAFKIAIYLMLLQNLIV